MGTLIYWCKEDNLEKYKQIHSKYNKDIVANSTLYKLLYKKDFILISLEYLLSLKQLTL